MSKKVLSVILILFFILFFYYFIKNYDLIQVAIASFGLGIFLILFYVNYRYLKPAIVIPAIISIGVLYTFITKYYNQDLNILSYFNLIRSSKENSQINIYAGEPGGVYYQLADKIVKRHPNLYKIHLPSPSGGAETAISVNNDEKGVGFVQEDIFRDNDQIKSELNYVAPIYMEKLHILYKKKLRRKNCLKDSIMKNTDPANYFKNKYLSIGYYNSNLKNYFAGASVASGKVGSASKILSSITLALNSTTPKITNVRKIANDNLDSAIIGLETNKYDCLFFISGQPNPKIQDLLHRRSNNFGFIGIEPSVVDEINTFHQSNYRYSNFNTQNPEGKYNGIDYSLPTLGSYCYIISNRKIKPYQLTQFVNHLDQVKSDMNIDFLNFKNKYIIHFNEKLSKTLASLLLALIGGISIGTLALAFIMALYSSYYHDKFTTEISYSVSRIPDESLPGIDFGNLRSIDENNLTNFMKQQNYSKEEQASLKTSLSKYYEEGKFNSVTDIGLINPYMYFNQFTLINDRIVTHISNLIKLRRSVSDAYRIGKLNTDHFDDLHSKMDTVINKMRKSLFLRINELINRSSDQMKLIKEDPKVKETLRNYLNSSLFKTKTFSILLW